MDCYGEEYEYEARPPKYSTGKPRQVGGPATCDICGKLFGSSSIDIHRPQCEKRRAKEEAEAEAQRRHENRKIRPMPGIICYICGKHFGQSSLAIHEKTCLQRWERENNQLPPGQRRPKPVKPQMMAFAVAEDGSPVGNGTSKYRIDEAAYADACLEASKLNMAECANCGRRFQPDRLPVHQRACKPGRAAKPVGQK
jgi:hypothetical protein